MSQEPEIDPRQVLWLLDRAKKQHAAARKLLDTDEYLAVTAAYEAMMGASVAWMMSHGVRPLENPDRADVLEFVEKDLHDEPPQSFTGSTGSLRPQRPVLRHTQQRR